MVAMALEYLGRLPEADAEVEKAREIFESLEPSWQTTYVYLQEAALSVPEGRFDDATQLMDEAMALAERHHDVQATTYGREILARRDLLLGQPAAIVERAGAQKESELGALEAEAYLFSGHEAEAERILADMPAGDDVGTPAALRVRALLSARRGRLDEAEAELNRAVEHARRIGYRREEGLALTVLGRLLAQRGDAASASQWFAQALAVFRDMGAQAYVDQVERAQLDLLHT
jgi:tetratricopeptide (TPR) repeat protein